MLVLTSLLATLLPLLAVSANAALEPRASATCQIKRDATYSYTCLGGFEDNGVFYVQTYGGSTDNVAECEYQSTDDSQQQAWCYYDVVRTPILWFSTEGNVGMSRARVRLTPA